MTGSDDSAADVYSDWDSLRRTYADLVGAGFHTWIAAAQAHHQDQRAFALGRLEEGIGLLHFFDGRLAASRAASEGKPAAPVRLLDVGTGVGGVALAFGNSKRYEVFSLDHLANRSPSILAARCGIPFRHVLASGAILPYAAASFDVVLLVDVIEHVARAAELGREVVRVLRPGGLCLVSTAARMRYVLAPDPHYGIRGLVALPNGLQRVVVDSVFRRRSTAPDGTPQPAYDVARTYTHVREIARLFPGTDAEPLYSKTLVRGAPFPSREWWRWRLKGFLFDHVLLTKA